MENHYLNSNDLIKQDPAVLPIQVDMMNMNGFSAVKRDGSWVLWELEKWPEVKIWLQNFQADLSQQYILMQVFKAGILNGRVFQCNEQRISIGLPAMADIDVERLSSYAEPWLAIDYHPNH